MKNAPGQERFSFGEGMLFHFLGQGGAGFELDNLLGGNLDALAGARVVTHAGGPLLNTESTEADQGNAVAFLEGVGRGGQASFKGFLGISFRQVGFLGDSVDQFCLVHD